jgi:hypothetical protein
MSYTWRSILHGVDLVKEGMCGELGMENKLMYGRIPGF